MDPARAPLGGPAAGDKPCVFKHFYMLRNGRHAYLKGLGQFCHRGFARHQVSENRSTRRVRERSEGGGELVRGAFRGEAGEGKTRSMSWMYCRERKGPSRCSGKRRRPAVLSGRLAFFPFTTAEGS